MAAWVWIGTDPLDHASLTTAVSFGGKCRTSQTSGSGSPESHKFAVLSSAL